MSKTAAVSTSITNFDPALKQIYRGRNFQEIQYRKRPLYGAMNKFEGFGGRDMPIPIKFGNPQGRSRSLAKAMANASELKLEDFVLTRVRDYCVSYIDGEAIAATASDDMAFLRALKGKADGTLTSLSNSIETKLFRGGDGTVAQTSAAGTIGTHTVGQTTSKFGLAEPEEITCFEVGMEIAATADQTVTTNLRHASDTVTITAVDRSVGVCTTSAATDLNTDCGYVDEDYVLIDGDRENTDTTLGCLAGLNAWLPTATPSGTYFGVTRSVDSRLYGQYHDGTSGPLEQNLIEAQSKAAREEESPENCFMHHAQYRQLILELGAKKEYSQVMGRDGSGEATVGYRAVIIEGDGGPIKVVAANKCPATAAYMLSMDGWTLNTIGPAVNWVDLDGVWILRRAQADGYEMRAYMYGNVGNNCPIGNVRIGLSSPS
jgi:hypothetical protein